MTRPILIRMSRAVLLWVANALRGLLRRTLMARPSITKIHFTICRLSVLLDRHHWLRSPRDILNPSNYQLSLSPKAAMLA